MRKVTAPYQYLSAKEVCYMDPPPPHLFPKNFRVPNGGKGELQEIFRHFCHRDCVRFILSIARKTK